MTFLNFSRMKSEISHYQNNTGIMELIFLNICLGKVTETVYLKCFVDKVDNSTSAISTMNNQQNNTDGAGGRNQLIAGNSRSLKMKRKYQKRRRRSSKTSKNRRYITSKDEFWRSLVDSDWLTDEPIEGVNRFMNCSVYPKHKVITWDCWALLISQIVLDLIIMTHVIV